jgi:hypothetical protein
LRWDSFEGLLDTIDLLDEVFQDLDAPSLRPAINELRCSQLNSSSHPIRKEEPHGGWVCSLI